MTSQPADVARAGTEKWHSELLLPKMQGLPDFAFTRTQTARSQARKQTQIRLKYTRRCKGPLNPLVGGHLTLKRVTELSQKDHKEVPGLERSLHSVLL